MNRSNLGWMLALGFVAWLPLAASAATIVPVSQTRSVSAFADGNPGAPASASFAASDFAPFNRTAVATSYQNPSDTFGPRIEALINQTSSIEDARIRMTTNGYLFTISLGGTGSVQTVFDVTFDLTLPSTYTIPSLIVRNGGTWAWALTDSNDVVLASQSGGFAGTLAPGRYRLNAQFDKSNLGSSAASGDGGFNGFVDLRVTVIPEPGTAALLALGLGSLAARRRLWTRSAVGSATADRRGRG